MPADRVGPRSDGVLVDVTTVISAQEYITAYNSGSEPEDPFARQCFVELVQTLILQQAVQVIHPLLSTPETRDFGDEPHLLQVLFAAGLTQPFRTPGTEPEDDHLAEELSESGVRMLLSFIDKSAEIDRSGRAHEFGDRLMRWTSYQDHKVRRPNSHGARIGTQDGIEDDALGRWVRATGTAARGELSKLAVPGFETALLAHLVRGLRYYERAAESTRLYQTHPTRRDFALFVNVLQTTDGNDPAIDLLREVRGIHETVKAAAGPLHSRRFEIAEITVPLLGGRLWKDDEGGRLNDIAWIERVGGYIAEYRSRAKPLRTAIANARTEESKLGLRRDLQELAGHLIQDLGFRPSQSTRIENDLKQVASVAADTVTGFPVVTAASIIGRKGVRRLFRLREPHAQFLYKELKRGYGGS